MDGCLSDDFALRFPLLVFFVLVWSCQVHLAEVISQSVFNYDLISCAVLGYFLFQNTKPAFSLFMHGFYNKELQERTKSATDTLYLFMFIRVFVLILFHCAMPCMVNVFCLLQVCRQNQ